MVVPRWRGKCFAYRREAKRGGGILNNLLPRYTIAETVGVLFFLIAGLPTSTRKLLRNAHFICNQSFDSLYFINGQL